MIGNITITGKCPRGILGNNKVSDLAELSEKYVDTSLGTFWEFPSPDGLTERYTLRCLPRFSPKRGVHPLYHHQPNHEYYHHNNITTISWILIFVMTVLQLRTFKTQITTNTRALVYLGLDGSVAERISDTTFNISYLLWKEFDYYEEQILHVASQP